MLAPGPGLWKKAETRKKAQKATGADTTDKSKDRSLGRAVKRLNDGAAGCLVMVDPIDEKNPKETIEAKASRSENHSLDF